MSEETTLLREMSDGGLVEFVQTEKSRAYYHTPKDGERKRMLSVTTILDGALPKAALIPWAEAEGARGAAELAQMGELQDVDPSEAIRLVRSHKLGIQAAKERGATRGLNIHSLLEDYARTGSPPNPADHPPEHAGYIQGLVRALLHLQPEPISVEQVVCHPELGYAGRMDLRARIGGRDTIVDLKTNVRGRAYAEAHVQAAAYALADVRCGAPEPDGTLIVCVGEDGSFEAVEGLAGPKAWEAVMGSFAAMKPIRAWIDAQHRAAKKALKAAA